MARPLTMGENLTADAWSIQGQLPRWARGIYEERPNVSDVSVPVPRKWHIRLHRQYRVTSLSCN